MGGDDVEGAAEAEFELSGEARSEVEGAADGGVVDEAACVAVEGDVTAATLVWGAVEDGAEGEGVSTWTDGVGIVVSRLSMSACLCHD